MPTRSNDGSRARATASSRWRDDRRAGPRRAARRRARRGGLARPATERRRRPSLRSRPPAARSEPGRRGGRSQPQAAHPVPRPARRGPVLPHAPDPGRGGRPAPRPLVDRRRRAPQPGDADLAGALRREWREELVADFDPEFDGRSALLNDDTTTVGAVHLGVVFVADAGGRDVRSARRTSWTAAFAAPADVAAVVDALETWSQLIVDDARSAAAGPVGADRMRPALLAGVAAAAVSALDPARRPRRGGQRLLDAPRTTPAEAGLGPALDALGGEVVRLRSRDGLRLAARWLPFDAAGRRRTRGSVGGRSARGDPAPARLLRIDRAGPRRVRRRSCGGPRACSGSTSAVTAPRTTVRRRSVLRRGRGRRRAPWPGSASEGSRGSPWSGPRWAGSRRIAAVAVLGDGTPGRRRCRPGRAARPPRRAPPARSSAVVGDSVAPALEVPIATRLRGPARRFVAARLFDGAASHPRRRPARRPSRPASSASSSPCRCCSSTATRTRPSRSPRAAAWRRWPGPSVEHWEVEGADHSRGHATSPAGL